MSKLKHAHSFYYYLLNRLKDSPVKSHIHVYNHEPSTNGDKESNTEDMMVPYHIDNGIYLIITPFPHQGLKLKTSTGQEIQTNLPSNSVLVLMGRALTDWLLVYEVKGTRYLISNFYFLISTFYFLISHFSFLIFNTYYLVGICFNCDIALILDKN